MATDNNSRSDLALLRLLQLASPTLPVGAYAYSQGMEYAVQAGWISNEQQAHCWIDGVLEHSLTRLDAPVLLRLHAAWTAEDLGSVDDWNGFLFASRESAELQAEDHTLARALIRLLSDLGLREADSFRERQQICFATLFALAGARWQITPRDIVQGYLWAWVENQVAAAIKLVPLGQTAGQRLLLALGERIPVLAGTALQLNDDDIGQVTQGLAMASAWHEEQYSRLFRS